MTEVQSAVTPEPSAKVNSLKSHPSAHRENGINIPFSATNPISESQKEVINDRIRRIAEITGNTVGQIAASLSVHFHFHGGNEVSAANYTQVCWFFGITTPEGASEDKAEVAA